MRVDYSIAHPAFPFYNLGFQPSAAHLPPSDPSPHPFNLDLDFPPLSPTHNFLSADKKRAARSRNGTINIQPYGSADRFAGYKGMAGSDPCFGSFNISDGESVDSIAGNRGSCGSNRCATLPLGNTTYSVDPEVSIDSFDKNKQLAEELNHEQAKIRKLTEFLSSEGHSMEEIYSVTGMVPQENMYQQPTDQRGQKAPQSTDARKLFDEVSNRDREDGVNGCAVPTGSDSVDTVTNDVSKIDKIFFDDYDIEILHLNSPIDLSHNFTGLLTGPVIGQHNLHVNHYIAASGYEADFHSIDDVHIVPVNLFYYDYSVIGPSWDNRHTSTTGLESATMEEETWKMIEGIAQRNAYSDDGYKLLKAGPDKDAAMIYNLSFFDWSRSFPMTAATGVSWDLRNDPLNAAGMKVPEIPDANGSIAERQRPIFSFDFSGRRVMVEITINFKGWDPGSQSYMPEWNATQVEYSDFKPNVAHHMDHKVKAFTIFALKPGLMYTRYIQLIGRSNVPNLLGSPESKEVGFFDFYVDVIDHKDIQIGSASKITTADHLIEPDPGDSHYGIGILHTGVCRRRLAFCDKMANIPTRLYAVRAKDDKHGYLAMSMENSPLKVKTDHPPHPLAKIFNLDDMDPD